MTFRNRLIAVTPMVCVFVYLLLGFVWGLWHPGWIIFLLIPIITTLIGSEKSKKENKKEKDYIDIE